MLKIKGCVYRTGFEPATVQCESFFKNCQAHSRREVEVALKLALRVWRGLRESVATWILFSLVWVGHVRSAAVYGWGHLCDACVRAPWNAGDCGTVLGNLSGRGELVERLAPLSRHSWQQWLLSNAGNGKLWKLVLPPYTLSHATICSSANCEWRNRVGRAYLSSLLKQSWKQVHVNVRWMYVGTPAEHV